MYEQQMYLHIKYKANDLGFCKRKRAANWQPF